ncbi:unnamed protein product [Pieris macdunnoughi]|uniref:Uncharacterized protein n=1 Tax=Pieris macdunnoughi TaxID=345717 RepID=A0A821XWK9_9NEOP|nr:unnamed protein product [Pieris macdunnoughi]
MESRHKKYGLDALLTRNLNQDPVENFFGNIRSYGNAEKPLSDEPETEIPCHSEILMQNLETVDAGQRNYVCGWVLTKLLKKSREALFRMQKSPN